MKRTLLCAAAATSAFFGVMTAAQAEEGQMRVDLAGVNLASADGATIALARIRHGASVFCEAGDGPQRLDRLAQTQKCQAEMTRKSVEQLNAPLVTALYVDGANREQRPALALARK